jgi:CheY-like chemotaxis protein
MADPHEFILLTYATYLEQQGYDVETAPTAEEALQHLERRDPDLIIMDMELPRMGGVAFLKRVTLERREARCPVLVFTTDKRAEERCRNLPVDRVLLKSVYGGELLREIRRILADRSAVQDVEAEAVKPTILLGEDEPALCETFRLTLEGAGYDVRIAGSGPDVIEEALRARPDLIVMKEVLCGLNGSLVAARLKSTGKVRQVPIILYDQLPLFRDHRFRGKTPDGVAMFVPTTDPVFLLQAIQDMFSRIPSGAGKQRRTR